MPDTAKPGKITLSPAQRSLVRRHITQHPGWPAHAKARGINSAQLVKEEITLACRALGINIRQIVTEANDSARAQAVKAFASIGGNADPMQPRAGLSRAEVRAIAKEECAFALQPRVIQTVVVERNNVTRSQPAGVVNHPNFETLCRVVVCRDYTGQRLNALLVGPTGTGKSFACFQIAELLGLPAYFHSVATEPYDLVGYVDVRGEYQETQFVKAFRDGGVCLLDELDRYDANALVALNAALASGKMSLPNGVQVTRHADFICVGAANTWGNGATAQFVAAAPLDRSTLSRFQAKIDWFVDPETENQISAAKASDATIAAAWLAEIRAVRAAAERLGLDLIADQRVVEAGAELLASGVAPETVRNLTYLAGLPADQVTGIIDLCFRDLVKPKGN